MQVRRWLPSPVVLVPILLVAAVTVATLIAPALTEDAGTRTADLYTAATEVAPAEASTPSTTPPSVLAGSGGAVEGGREDTREDTRNNGGEATPVLLAGPARMRIERLGVEAGLVTLGIDADGNMAAPDGPELVGWYDFTGRPGAGSGNAVVAGHRDWRGHGPAVFYALSELERGDVIEVELLDGSLVRYTVTAGHTYPVAELDMREILARTQEETLTLITCAGAFQDNDYTDRHVVRATRTEAIPAQAADR